MSWIFHHMSSQFEQASQTHLRSPTSTPNRSPSASERQSNLQPDSLLFRRCLTPLEASAPSLLRLLLSCAWWARTRSSLYLSRQRRQSRPCSCPSPSQETRHRPIRQPPKL